jgi:hypothetical protein
MIYTEKLDLIKLIFTIKIQKSKVNSKKLVIHFTWYL